MMQVQEFVGERTRLINRGQTVHLPDNCYVRTNHFIKQSRDFVRSPVKLRQFWRFPWMRLFFAIYFLLTLPCFVTWLYACIACFITILWLLFFLQHVYVLAFSLRIVMKQPVVPNLRKLNAIYELQVDQIQGVYRQVRQFGIGTVATSRESIKFQVFNREGYQTMLAAKHWSRIMIVFTLILFVWSLSWALAETAAPLIVRNMHNPNLTIPCGFMFALSC